MEITRASSLKTELKDRVLWFDGDSVYPSDDIMRLIRQYNVRYVDHINETVQQYNKHVAREQELGVKTEFRDLDYTWNIPQEYKTLNVGEYVFDKLISTTRGCSEEEFGKRAIRVINEMTLYETRGFIDVLRTIIYIINTLTATNTVWGVGRGSSVSSYVLYLIGAHDVDSYAYNLDINDFLHD